MIGGRERCPMGLADRAMQGATGWVEARDPLRCTSRTVPEKASARIREAQKRWPVVRVQDHLPGGDVPTFDDRCHLQPTSGQFVEQCFRIRIAAESSLFQIASREITNF